MYMYIIPHSTVFMGQSVSVKKKTETLVNHSYLNDNDSIIVDDTVSYNRNMKKLMAELAKPRPVGENLEDLMKLTYPNRRSSILFGEATLLDICDEFPLLKKPKGVNFSVTQYQ